MDPTLLQSLYLCKGKLLGLKIGTQNIHSPGQVYNEIINNSCSEWKSNAQQMIRNIQNLPPGAYRAHVPKHATAYIKISNDLGFFFDPNHGIVEINGADQGLELYLMFSKVLKRTGEIENQPTLNAMRFVPVIKR